MKRFYGIAAVVIGMAGIASFALFSQGRRAADTPMPSAVTFRVLLGLGDTQPSKWDGKVEVSGGDVVSIQGWRFADSDSTDYKSTWKASTHPGPPPAGRAARKAGPKQGAVQENGVMIAVRLSSEGARFNITTAQGNFSFAAQEVPLGESKTFLDGKAAVDRVPSAVQITTSDEEQDHPALAQSGDEVYLAYVDFTHGERQAAKRVFDKEPQSFDFLTRPTGGDQVKLMTYSKAKSTWSAAEDVTPAKQDVMRTAVAVDGSKRVWVVYSANRGNNFDIYAKVRSQGKWSAEMRLTTDAGTDVNPVAATDSEGRVWVAWQAYRNGSLDILAAVQNGDKFGKEAVVSFSKMSDWDPSIAAGRNGEVAVVWDTYDKGDYDVYLRKLKSSGGKIDMQKPMAVAASQNFEARATVAYDPQNRIWVAYEGADVKWGKDFGAYETTGVALYQGHTLKVRCIEGDKMYATTDDMTDALNTAGQVRRPKAKKRAAMTAGANGGVTLPDPSLAKNRPPSATPQNLIGPKARNSFPRISVDPGGAVFVAYRSSDGTRSPLGTTWNEYVSYFDGEEWQGPLLVPHTDGLLDIRPALAPLGNGHLLMVASSDHRMFSGPGRARRTPDEINTDLYASELRLGAAAKAAKLTAVAPEKVAGSQADVKPEVDQVALMRKYRVNAGGANLQIMRGEFHRHTEMSGDGGGDGPLIDAYRYMIDAAYMDWGGCCDHDNGGGREYYWWTQQKLTDAYNLPGTYTPMFSYERSVRYPEGHRNVVMPRRGIRPLPRLEKLPEDAPMTQHAPDTQMLYKYLKQYDGIVASHTSGTDMGTDWRDNDPIVEPVVEIYQGDRQSYEMPDAPRHNKAEDSIGGWRPLGFVSLALKKGYRMGFQASSDHVSTHMSYCNLWVTSPTREGVMEAFHKRRVYGATDNILADVRSGSHFMGEEFTTSEPPSISVKLWGTDKFAKVHVIKDSAYAYTITPNTKTVDFSWKDSAATKGQTSYYYVRGEQADGEIVWVSPLWITYK